jgi:hypothetical protein
MARRPFNPSRQRKKGAIVDLPQTAVGTKTLRKQHDGNVGRVLLRRCARQGNSANVAAVAATDDFTVDSSADFLSGSLVFAKGFDNAANNGLHLCNGITDATHISTASALTDEAAGAAKIVQVVGYQFPADDVTIAVVGGVARLTSATIDLTTLGLIPGEYVFVGGQAAGNQFGAVLPGYCRVADVTATHIDFDKTTMVVGAGDDGVGTTLQIFFGTVIRNEDDPDDIVKYTHTVERTLGRDEDGRQSEYIDGFVYNELTWNSPLADKVNVDIKGVGMTHHTRTGAEGPLIAEAGASIVAALSEDAFNTSSNVYRLRMALLDPATLNPSPLFARVTEWKATIKNNVSGNKAQGTLGAFSSTAGSFDVDMEATAYFSHTSGIKSIADNADVTFDAIYAKQNAAIVFDYPLVQNGGGRSERRYGQADYASAEVRRVRKPVRAYDPVQLPAVCA